MISDLSPSVGIIPAVAGVDDVRAVIHIVDIPTRHNDRVCSVCAGAADSRLQGAMNMRVMELASIDEELARAGTVGCTKESRHACTILGEPGVCAHRLIGAPCMTGSSTKPIA